MDVNYSNFLLISVLIVSVTSCIIRLKMINRIFGNKGVDSIEIWDKLSITC